LGIEQMFGPLVDIVSFPCLMVLAAMLPVLPPVGLLLPTLF
jgi:hypothetical protein